MTIALAGSVDAFFAEIVNDALRTKRVQASDAATNYLVALLADQAHLDRARNQTLDRPLAFLLDEALHTASSAERFERLRSLGDGVLYSSGFFGDHFEARGVAPGYLVGIGAAAYGGVATMLRPSSDEPRQGHIDIFRELAEKFAAFVDVLADVANATLAMGATGSTNVLRIYERWLKTGSDRLASALGSQGLLPQRGSKGVMQ